MSNAKKTALYEEHKKLGGRLVNFAGWELPIQYSNLKEEVLAVRNHVGAFDVSHMGEFLVEGVDTEKFLNHALTNDVSSIDNFKALYSPMCNKQGKILDDLIIYKYNAEKILICVNASNLEKDFNWLNEQVEKFDCSLKDISQETSLIALQGPNSENQLQKLVPTADLKSLQYYSFLCAEDLIISRTGYTGEDGFEIFCSHDQACKIWSELISNGVTPCGLGARDVLRLEVCYPLYGHELDETITPLDAGLKWTVKLSKNDFLGKEHMENPQFKLIKLVLDKGIPRQGYEVVQNHETIGTITSGTMSVMLNKGIALARVDINKYSQGEEIFVNIRGKQYVATQTNKAFYSGGHK